MTDATSTRNLIQTFLNAVAAGDRDGMIAQVSDGLVHDINQGGERRIGKDRFSAYTARMQHHYAESIRDVIIMVSDDGTRAAAEYNLEGRYVQTEDGLPPACGQTYSLPAAMFFAVNGDSIERITTYYNLTDWLTQIVTGAEGYEPTPIN